MPHERPVPSASTGGHGSPRAARPVAALLLAVVGAAGAPPAHAGRTFQASGRRLVADASVVARAKIVDVSVDERPCIDNVTLRVTLEEALRGELPAGARTAPLAFSLQYLKGGPGCPRISLELPPRARARKPGAEVLVTLECRAAAPCRVTSSYDMDALPRVQTWLRSASEKGLGDARCAAAETPGLPALGLEPGEKGSVAGHRFAFLSTGRKIRGPLIAELTVAGAGERERLRLMSDGWHRWRRHGADLCWRIADVRGDAEWIEIEAFRLRAARRPGAGR